MIAVEIRVDVLNNVRVIPAQAISRHDRAEHAPQQTGLYLLSRINRISFTSVSMLVVDDICEAASESPHTRSAANQHPPSSF
jgi:hypothetical protein